MPSPYTSEIRILFQLPKAQNTLLFHIWERRNSRASILYRSVQKIEGSKLAANSYFERTTMTREKDETNKEKARPQNERPRTGGASALGTLSLDPKLVSGKKRLDSKDVN